MLKRLVELFEYRRNDVYYRYVKSTELIKDVVNDWRGCSGGFIRKGQEQLMCDYLWLELLEQGIIK